MSSTLTRHHLVPISRGGTNRQENLIMVGEELHQAWHQIFQDQLPEECLQTMLNNWFDRERVTAIEYRRWHHSHKLFTTAPVKKSDRQEHAWQVLQFPPKAEDVLSLWLGMWVPGQYFNGLSVYTYGQECKIIRFSLARPLVLSKRSLNAAIRSEKRIEESRKKRSERYKKSRRDHQRM